MNRAGGFGSRLFPQPENAPMSHPQDPDKPRLPNPYLVGTAPANPAPFGGKGDHDAAGKAGGAKKSAKRGK